MTPIPGLDLDAVARFLDPAVGGLSGTLQAEVIPGGRSNLTYRVTDGETTWALRRPPLAHVLPTAHDMTREERILRALESSSIPVPRVVASSADIEITGAPFYVMEWVDGNIIRNRLPLAYPRTPTTRQELSTALVDTLVSLHAIDPATVGLGDFGRPDGFLERQVRRWWQQWEASKTRELPSIEELHRRLQSSIPEQSPHGIVHGDYRLDNIMFAPHDPSQVVAVLDWEMATIGDPLCDLGLLLVYWSDSDDDPAAIAIESNAITRDDGFFSRLTLIHEYSVASHRSLENLDWYVVLGLYKLAIIAEGITARHKMGMTVGEGFEAMGEMVPELVEHALRRADRSRVAGLAAGAR